MPMAATGGRVQAADSTELPIDSGAFERRGKPMKTLMVTNEHSSNDGFGLHSWRIVVFGTIGALYVVSLFVPPLREALAKVFSYFPQ